jgi:asparagine synthase (glutamine-hydrolysing)
MSAIAGILRLDRGQTDVDLAERMVAQLGHRGPDDEGSYRSPDGLLAMAARRQAVTDRSGAAGLPIANETHDVWLALDGEIYNHRVLRHALELDGHRFRSNSDAEAALHAYEQWGLDFPHHLQGAFALALWDDRHDRLVLVRDRMGRKPLFFAEQGCRLAFASAIKPLIEALEMPRRLDPAALAQYLGCGHVLPPTTLVAGVQKLAAGEMLVADRDGPPYRTRWARPPTDRRRAALVRAHGIDRQAGNLRTLIECAIADRLMGDAAIGALIGPGLDGGVAAAIMSRLTGRPVEAVTVIDAADPDGAAARDARLIARAARAEVHEVAAGAEKTAADLPLLVRAFGEPIGDPACLLWWWAGRGCAEARLAAVLAGEGADEVMLGHAAPHRGGTVLARKLRHWLNWLAGRPKLASGRPPAGTPGWAGLLGPEAGDATLPSTADTRVPDLPDWLEADQRAAEGWLDLAGRMAEATCPRIDSMVMAHGVSARLPYLDETLISYAVAVPSHQRAPAGASKYLWRRAMADLLPPELADRAATPRSLPLESWLATGPLAEAVERDIAQSALFRNGILAAGPARDLLAAHRAGGGHARLLWSLLALSQWAGTIGLDGIAPREGGWTGTEIPLAHSGP